MLRALTEVLAKGILLWCVLYMTYDVLILHINMYKIQQYELSCVILAILVVFSACYFWFNYTRVTLDKLRDFIFNKDQEDAIYYEYINILVTYSAGELNKENFAKKCDALETLYTHSLEIDPTGELFNRVISRYYKQNNNQKV